MKIFKASKGRKHFPILILLALAGGIITILTVFFKPTPPIKQLEDPYLHFFEEKNVVFGAGVIIPKGEEIDIKATEDRKVIKIFVKEGEKIHQGDPLIQLYDKELKAQVLAKEASLSKSKIELERLQSLPRPEDLAVQKALYSQARIESDEATRQFNIAQELFDKSMLSRGEYDQKKYSADVAHSKLEHAKTELDKMQAGAWKPDLDAAKSDVAYQTANLEAIKNQLNETLITAPADATVLKINVQVGEAALTNRSDPLMILGDLEECYVEISVDQNEISRLDFNQEATAFFRGIHNQPIALYFVRKKPLVVPKKNLTSASNERVDTKVVQLVYGFKKKRQCESVGSLMDVFIPTQIKP